MRRRPHLLLRLLVSALTVTLLSPAPARCAGRADRTEPVADSTWVDHDRQPIRRPPDWQPSYWGQRTHQGFTEPLVHVFDVPDKLLLLARVAGVRTRREAVDVNAFDEVPNSSWFTNRNHVRAVPVAALAQGPDSVFLPTKPWTVEHAKLGGWSPGFQVKDAEGRKWLVKLDTRGFPQLSSGADMVARTLLHAAGYNVPHNETVRFRRADIVLDPALPAAKQGERFTPADLDSLLARGACLPDGSYIGTASLYLHGHALGSPSMSRRRPGDTNDRYSHENRRELRGLFVLCSWIGDWDAEDHQFLDEFVEGGDSLGHVEHYVLDVGSSFGASAIGTRKPWEGYEYAIDLGWTARRIVTLGFVEEPWRRSHQATGIPSAGLFASDQYRPQDFRELVPQPAFRRLTDRDGYWGAKIVASFSDAQVAAAVDAARFDDRRARDYLVRNLIVRRDAIARHWFGRVAPLDFFCVRGGELRFRDLAVDVGLEGARAYDAEVERGSARHEHVHLGVTAIPLGAYAAGPSHLVLEIAVSGSRAAPVHVELTRDGGDWIVTRVRHG